MSSVLTPHAWLHAMPVTRSHMSPFLISLHAGKGDTLGLRETPPSLPLPHRRHLLSANPEGIMEGGRERKDIEANSRLESDIS